MFRGGEYNIIHNIDIQYIQCVLGITRSVVADDGLPLVLLPYIFLFSHELARQRYPVGVVDQAIQQSTGDSAVTYH